MQFSKITNAKTFLWHRGLWCAVHLFSFFCGFWFSHHSYAIRVKPNTHTLHKMQFTHFDRYQWSLMIVIIHRLSTLPMHTSFLFLFAVVEAFRWCWCGDCETEWAWVKDLQTLLKEKISFIFTPRRTSPKKIELVNIFRLFCHFFSLFISWRIFLSSFLDEFFDGIIGCFYFDINTFVRIGIGWHRRWITKNYTHIIWGCNQVTRVWDRRRGKEKSSEEKRK